MTIAVNRNLSNCENSPKKKKKKKRKEKVFGASTFICSDGVAENSNDKKIVGNGIVFHESSS